MKNSMSTSHQCSPLILMASEATLFVSTLMIHLPVVTFIYPSFPHQDYNPILGQIFRPLSSSKFFRLSTLGAKWRVFCSFLFHAEPAPLNSWGLSLARWLELSAIDTTARSYTDESSLGRNSTICTWHYSWLS